MPKKIPGAQPPRLLSGTPSCRTRARRAHRMVCDGGSLERGAGARPRCARGGRDPQTNRIVPAESLSKNSTIVPAEPLGGVRPSPGAETPEGPPAWNDSGIADSPTLLRPGTGALRHLLFRQALNLRELWLIRCRPGGSRVADWSSAETCPSNNVAPAGGTLRRRMFLAARDSMMTRSSGCCAAGL